MPLNTTLLSFFLIAFTLTTRAESKSVREEVKTSQLHFIFTTSEIASLTYQLDCLADLIHCDQEPIKEFWAKQDWKSSDDSVIKKWGKLQEKYANVGGKLSETIQENQEQVGFPLRNNAVGFDRKFRIASFISDNIEDYRKSLSLLMLPSDARDAIEIVETFRPRHEKWWQNSGYPKTKDFTQKFTALLKEKDLFSVIEKVSHFYQANLSPKTPIYFHFFILPGKNDHSSGEQIEDHSVVEVLDGEEPIDRVDVILHELFHYLYRSVSYEQHRSFVKSFVDSKDPTAIVAYNLLNEALATSLGNGIVFKKVQPSETFQKYFAKEKSFYADDAIDGVAKKLMPILEKDLDSNVPLYSPDFISTYLKAAKEALGMSATRPALALRTHFAFYNYDFDKEYQKFDRIIRSGFSWTSTTLNHEDSIKRIKDSPHASGLLLLKPSDFPLPTPWNSILGAKNITNLSKALRKKSPFIYTANRTENSWIFIVVASESEVAKNLLSKIEAAKSIEELRH